MDVCERFLKYVSYPTMSDENSNTVPSTEKQKALGKLLAEELKALGLADARMDACGYVYATLPANADAKASIGFIAHMDTSPDAPDAPVSPKVVKYTGGDLLLNPGKDLWLRPADYPNLHHYVGTTIAVTDGTTLLGGDDKAGIAAIMCAVERIVKNGLPHGKICIAFTPDEEIGCGADHFDVEGFGADYAYTVDGGAVGELEYENFNAASAEVTVYGVSIHPGAAKGKMKNAALIAMEFDTLLPQNELPVLTEGYEGFHHLCGMSGEVEHAVLDYIVRDHDLKKFAAKKAQFLEAAEKLNEKYGEGTVEVKLTDSYFNMREIIEKNPLSFEEAKQAMLDCGIEPKIQPIRGGTDGARLSFMGLPCPNLGTGDENAHSRFEYVSVDGMEKNVELLCRIAARVVK